MERYFTTSSRSKRRKIMTTADGREMDAQVNTTDGFSGEGVDKQEVKSISLFVVI